MRLMVFANMVTQYIASEIPCKIAPRCVNVVGSVLRVGVLKQKARPLDSVVMRLELNRLASPGKSDLIQPIFLDLSPVLFCNNSTVAFDIFLDE